MLFIDLLRTIAAVLITNAHYTGIYPTDIIANGGLLGDIIFFSVSGYCLYNIKLPFYKWYIKRLYRIYPSIIIITFVYILLGQYSLHSNGIFWWFVYPTYYHFVASIVVLYVPFYFCLKIDLLRKRIGKLMIFLAAIWFVVYCTVYDTSYYHIDTVQEPMIRFLFFECMLLGAWFRQNDQIIRNNGKYFHRIATLFAFIVYFATKVLLSKGILAPKYQFVNQISVVILLYFLFYSVAGIDSKLEKIPQLAMRVIKGISRITLEIYAVQYVIIDAIRSIGYDFPLNWFLLTGTIVVASICLYKARLRLDKIIFNKLHVGGKE